MCHCGLTPKKLPELAVGQAMRRASGGGVVSLKFGNPGFRGFQILLWRVQSAEM